MRTIVTLLMLVVPMLTTTARAAGPDLKTDEDKAWYAAGFNLGSPQQLGMLGLTEHELDLLKAGLTDAVLKHPQKADPKTYLPKFQELAKARTTAAATAIAAVEKKTGAAFADKAAKEKGATKTASGLVYQEITPGTGESPKATDKVKVHYKGTLTDGTVFDSSIERGQPVSFGLNQVIKCWGEGVPMIKVGGKSKLICPSDIAYGDSGRPPTIKPGATLVFEVELLSIEQPAAASPATP